MKFDDLLFQIDDEESTLKCTFSDGTPVWPVLRWQLRLAFMQSQKLEEHKQTPIPTSSVSLWRFMWFCFLNKPNYKNQPDILSIANYEGNPETPNRMTVFLKQLNEFNCEEWLYSEKKRTFDNLNSTYSFDYLFFKSWVLSKFKFYRKNKSNAETILKFADEILTKFNVFIPANFSGKIRAELLFIDGVITQYRIELRSALRRKDPRFILTSEGNNGEWKHAVLFQVAKELKIPTAEVQHGVFNIGMKYGEKLAASPKLKQLKSDYQFVFGPYHQTLTNAPVKCIPFGHYDLQKSAKQFEVDKTDKDSDILKIAFICEGNPPSSVNNGLITQTYAALTKLERKFRLLVRLHPSEAPSVVYDDLFKFEGTRYSDYKIESIYEVINWADCVVSHASTVVFESLYFNKPVFVLRDENTDQYIPPGIGISFKEADELYDYLSRPDINPIDNDIQEYWTKTKVEHNFRQFWNDYIVD